MKLPKFSFVNTIELWQPRWRDKVVLLDTRKIGEHNVVHITKAGKSWDGNWYVSGKTVKLYAPEQHPTKSGGHILLHPVPLDELVVYEGKEDGQQS